uniref:Uncharacterized protein n=1 Tax=Oryza sativa subsp. japonica TaxID=39947 RepID=Q6YSW6_ORYSJ|nr:hypothetical protein [Oryza sativa Japonica Group]BAD31997.1 hypothetical protein [Oryza sativa Japonica Group]
MAAIGGEDNVAINNGGRVHQPWRQRRSSVAVAPAVYVKRQKQSLISIKKINLVDPRERRRSVGAASAFDLCMNKTSMYEGAANSCTVISAN